MASRRRPSKSGDPLDARQQQLLEEQEKIRERVEQLNQVIADAPRIAEERARARRDELLTDRSTRAHHRLNSTTLADTRYDPFPRRSTPRRPLKAERRQTRLIFCALLVVLAVLVVFLLNIWHLQWPG